MIVCTTITVLHAPNCDSHSVLLCSALLRSTLLHYAPLYSTPTHCNMLPFKTQGPTLLNPTPPPLQSTPLYFALLYRTQPGLALLYATIA